MSSATAARWATWLLLASLVLPVAARVGLLSEGQALTTWESWTFRGAAGLLGLAVLLYGLEKVGLRVSGARCSDCGRRVPHGRRYCHDHLRDRALAARAKFHGERGLGI